MNFRTTIFLLIAVIVVASAALWFSRTGHDSPSPPANIDQSRLIDLSEGEITRIERVDASGEVLVLDRRGSDWRLSKPVTAPADRSAVGQLLSSLTSLRSRGQVALEGNESATGLDRPVAVVTLGGREGKSVRLAVGARAGTGGNVYVRVDARPQADLVAGVLLDDLDRPAAQFRDRLLVHLPSPQVSRIVLSEPDQPQIELRRDGEQWRMVRPFDAPAELSAASDVAFALTGLRAVEFVSESAEKLDAYGLEAPVLVVTVESGEGTTQPAGRVVRFGGYDDVLQQNVYAIADEQGPVVKVPAASLEPLRRPPLDFRDRRVLDLAPGDVRRVSIAVEPGPTTEPAPPQPLLVFERVPVPPVPPEAPTTAPAVAPTATPDAPTTAPNQPTAAPVESSDHPRWRIVGDAEREFDPSAVDSMLEAFHPLRAGRYLETLNFVAPPAGYLLSFELSDGSTRALRLLEGGESPTTVFGTYDDLVFEAPAWVLARVKTVIDAR